MKGTFKPGDKLIIEKVSFNQIKNGDVLIFRRMHEKQSDFIVHRVVSRSLKGFVTRGDNSIISDKDPVLGDDISGRVIRYNRRGRILKVHNGWLGQIRANLMHIRLHLIISLKFFLRKPYIRLKKTGIIAKLWQPNVRIVQFETPVGPLIKLIHNSKTVAIFWKGKDRWPVKRPYDLIINNNAHTGEN